MHKLWTKKEEELMHRFYPHVGDTIEIDEIAALLNRSVTAVREKARHLKLEGGYRKDNINLEIQKQLERRIEI